MGAGTCADLHALLTKTRRRLTFPPPFIQLPLNGVYFIFEKGQSSHDADRIIRIGSHRGPNRLVARLWEHAMPHGRSIFRWDLGKALIRKPGTSGIDPIPMEFWEAESNERLKEIGGSNVEVDRFEVQLSAYISKTFEFSVIGTADQAQGMELEKACIATVATCAHCQTMANSDLRPPRGILWNKHHAGPNSQPLSASQWTELVGLASAPLGARNDQE